MKTKNICLAALSIFYIGFSHLAFAKKSECTIAGLSPQDYFSNANNPKWVHEQYNSDSYMVHTITREDSSTSDRKRLKHEDLNDKNRAFINRYDRFMKNKHTLPNDECRNRFTRAFTRAKKSQRMALIERFRRTDDQQCEEIIGDGEPRIKTDLPIDTDRREKETRYDECQEINSALLALERRPYPDGHFPRKMIPMARIVTYEETEAYDSGKGSQEATKTVMPRNK
jgi:hypothetical protein